MTLEQAAVSFQGTLSFILFLSTHSWWPLPSDFLHTESREAWLHFMGTLLARPLVFSADVLSGCWVLLGAGPQRLSQYIPPSPHHLSPTLLSCLHDPGPEDFKAGGSGQGWGGGAERFTWPPGIGVVGGSHHASPAYRCLVWPVCDLATDLLLGHVFWPLSSQLQIAGDILLSHADWLPPYHSMEADWGSRNGEKLSCVRVLTARDLSSPVWLVVM